MELDPLPDVAAKMKKLLVEFFSFVLVIILQIFGSAVAKKLSKKCQVGGGFTKTVGI